ncbi:glycoside hydrolase family 6 protein [Kineococcus glutinatus]|uniref:Glucanase n=1 Tax=Kineococcus glutinatus TaxID=1070872 RepID=A0ABP9HYH2_9ACTN
MRRTAAAAVAVAAPLVLTAPADAASTWTLTPSSAGRVSGSGISLWANASASTTATGSGGVVLTARADLCGAQAPVLEVSADGRVLGRVGVVNAASTPYRSYVIGSGLTAGTHAVVVRYVNDASIPGTCDRNVHVQQVAMSTTGTQVPTPTATPTATATATPTATATAAPVGGNVFATAAPYADPTYTSAAEAAARRSSDPAGAAALDRMTRGGVSLWVGDWNSTGTVARTVREYALRANAAGRTGVVTTYAIPGRDCGNFSAGGLTAATYNSWTAQVAEGLRGTRTAVVVEPDAIAQHGACEGQGDRLGLIRTAVQQLRAAGITAIYLDAGNSAWTGGQVQTMADRLTTAGISMARGFSTNVSNFVDTAAERAYAERLSALTGGSRYVIDTSRNGRGSDGQWCNPLGRKLGAAPGAVSSGNQDANLWIKRVGESDGTCNGGPAAGVFWAEYAIGLAS